MHKVKMADGVLERLKLWRGKNHMFEHLDPIRVAHLVIDLQNGFMEPGATVEVPVARAIVPNVNLICEAVRRSGGTNYFIRYLIDKETHGSWSSWFEDFHTPSRAKMMDDTFGKDCHGFKLWSKLDVRPEDQIVDKTRFGAFVPGASNLHDLLQVRGIDTLIITGTATNVCCESTARDAMQMNYKVIFVSDGNATFSDDEHNATLNNIASNFVDIMTAEEVARFLERAAAARDAAE